VYLTGFGQSGRAAAGTGNLTGASGSPGPAPYSSPEQVRGDIIGGRADQYSLACVAFQLLTGHLPYDNDDGPSALLTRTAGPAPSLSERRPDLPATADPVLARAMAATPGERYPTCQDFTDALRAALGLPGATSDRNHASRPGGSRPAAASPGIQAARRGPVTGLTTTSADPASPAQGSRRRLPAIIAATVIVVAAAIAVPLAITGSSAPHKPDAARSPASRRSSSRLSLITTLTDPNGLQAPDAFAFAPDGRTLTVTNPAGYVESWNTSTDHAGSVKWLDQPFDSHDPSALQRGATQVPGFDAGSTALIAVSREGFTGTANDALTLSWQPANVVGAFT
ncbi:MAG: serine/threonine protein kinase, partial [Trebonia sp.]